MSYFCFNYTNTFFIHTINYFSNVYGELFFHSAENYFSQCREFILGLQCFVGLAVKVDWLESLTSLGDHFENFEVEECFQRECHGKTLSGKETKEVFIWIRIRSFFLNFRVGDTLILCVFIPKANMCSTRWRLEVQDWVENSSIGQTCHVW